MGPHATAVAPLLVLFSRYGVTDTSRPFLIIASGGEESFHDTTLDGKTGWERREGVKSVGE